MELILQSIIRQERILVTAPSNIAVDTILIRLAVALDEAMQQQESSLSATDRDRLAYAKKNLVRIGHPARIHPITQMYSLDCRISTDDVCSLNDCFSFFTPHFVNCSFIV